MEKYLEELIGCFVGIIFGLICLLLIDSFPDIVILYPFGLFFIGAGFGGLAVTYELYKIEKKLMK